MIQGQSVPELLRSAVAAHQAGRLAEAEALYRQILSVMPNFTDALHLLGVLAYQTRHLEAAEAMIARAIQISPEVAQYRSDYAVVLTAMGRHDEARRATEKMSGPPQPRMGLSGSGFVLPDLDVITNPKRSDGFGAQFQTIIYSVIYAELNQKKFVYTPFKSMEHNYDNDPEFLLKKERLINFMPNFEVNENLDQAIPLLFFIQYFEQNLDLCAGSESLKKIKKIFRMNKPIVKREGVYVAIHIRRPNSHDSRLNGSDTPDTVFLNIIHSLKRDIYPDKLVNIHIYSQGSEEMFETYKSIDNVHLHLNGPVEETFTDFVCADVLVTSRSSLSYVAGLLSEGEVYYLPFWHPPLRHWRVIA